jgi:hypothetical protein
MVADDSMMRGGFSVATDFVADKGEEPLNLHPKSWNQQDLIEQIVARYFGILSNRGGRWPTYTIQSLDEDDDIHTTHRSLNQHLEKLGWMSKILNDEPYALIVFPTPERQFASSKTKSLFWFFSFFTSLLAGSLFVEHMFPTTSERLMYALTYYSLPIMFVLFLANAIQKSIGKKHGVRLGPILPIPDPSIILFYFGILPQSLLLWPFGILFLPTLPRMDARPWPDRYSLGISSIAAPILFFVSGCILFLSGLFFTQDFVEISGQPYAIEPPLLMEFLSQTLRAESADVLYAWAHPFVFVGMFFLLLSWVLLLPVPTFPGGRIMISRMGMMEARSASTQTFLLLVFLIFALLFDVFSSFGIWFLILSICLPLIFFYGSDIRSPFITNETIELNESQHRRLGTFLILIFILALPNQAPLGFNDSWDEPLMLTTDTLAIATLQDDGTWLSKTQIDFENPSSIEQKFTISAYIENEFGDWQLQWDCAGEETYTHDGEGCGADVRPGYLHRMWLNLTWNSPHVPYATDVMIVVGINDELESFTWQLVPDAPIYTSESWIPQPSSLESTWCTEIYTTSIQKQQFNVSLDYLRIDNLQADALRIQGVLSNATIFSENLPEELCFNGLDEIIHFVAQPILQINNRSYAPMFPALRELQMIVPSEGWHIRNDETSSWGSYFDHDQIVAANEPCPLNPVVSVPTKPSQGQWVWNTNIKPIARIPHVGDTSNLTMLVEPSQNISICDDSFNPYPLNQMTSIEGPEMVAFWQGGMTRLWTTPWFVAMNGTFFAAQDGNLTLHNPNDEDIPFRLSIVGDGDPWTLPSILIENESLPQGTHQFQFIPPNSPYSAFWISHQSGEIVFHFTSFR